MTKAKRNLKKPRSKPLSEYIHKKLQNPKERAAYINAALEDGDPKILLAVLKDCVEALEGDKSVSFSAHPKQVVFWKREVGKLGVKDFQAFIRGAIQSALFVSKRANDSSWKSFLKAAQPLAKKHLGYGIYDGGAKDFESSGTATTGISFKETLSRLKKK